jgi:hypothetical protein
VEDYIGDIEEGNLGCNWDPTGKWHRAHGDGKSASGGKFFTQTMKTSGSPPQYRVRVMQGKSVALGPFGMPGDEQPTNDEVVAELKSKV